MTDYTSGATHTVLTPISCHLVYLAILIFVTLVSHVLLHTPSKEALVNGDSSCREWTRTSTHFAAWKRETSRMSIKDEDSSAFLPSQLDTP